MRVEAQVQICWKGKGKKKKEGKNLLTAHCSLLTAHRHHHRTRARTTTAQLLRAACSAGQKSGNKCCTHSSLQSRFVPTAATMTRESIGSQQPHCHPREIEFAPCLTVHSRLALASLAQILAPPPILMDLVDCFPIMSTYSHAWGR